MLNCFSNSPYISGLIIGGIFGLITSFVIMSMFIKTNKAIKGENVKFDMSCNMKRWAPVGLINLLYGAFIGISYGYNSCQATNGFFSWVLVIIMIILFPIVMMISYIGSTRDMSLKEVFSLGLSASLSNLGSLICFAFYYIPLIVLIAITFGILSIWKGFEICLGYSMMLEQSLYKYENKVKQSN